MNVLAIYIEPAPYVVDLIRVLRKEYPNLQMRVLFIGANVSQSWNAQLDREIFELLSSNRIRSIFQIIKEVVAGRFDWLHLAGWGHLLLMLALVVGRLSGRRISVESDTQAPLTEPRHKRAIKAALYPTLFRAACLFFPGGRPQARYLRNFSVPEHHIRISQMTVDVTGILETVQHNQSGNTDRRLGLGMPHNAVVFIFVGRLESFKGIETLLMAFDSICDEGLSYLLIVGDGSLRGEVEQAQESNGRIRYLGWQDTNGVRGAMASADVAVVPSSFEPWGLVVNEAMAAGLPVIASDRVGAVEDLVSDNENGLIIPADSPGALAEAMRLLARDTELRHQMARASHRRIDRWRLEDEARIMWTAWNDLKSS